MCVLVSTLSRFQVNLVFSPNHCPAVVCTRTTVLQGKVSEVTCIEVYFKLYYTIKSVLSRELHGFILFDNFEAHEIYKLFVLIL